MKKINEKDFTTKENLLLEIEYNLITNFIKLRKGQHITQRDLAEMSKVIRQTINRIEKLVTTPSVRTMIKILEPLGYTLEIVPLKKGEQIKWEEI